MKKSRMTDMIMKNDEMIIEYDSIIHETEDAYLIVVEDNKHWFPRSITEIDEDFNCLKAPLWFLNDKGLI